jgi:hypothetical protein
MIPRLNRMILQAQLADGRKGLGMAAVRELLAGGARQQRGHALQRGGHEAVVDSGAAALAVDDPGFAQDFR